jgi:hypothetical protein
MEDKETLLLFFFGVIPLLGSSSISLSLLPYEDALDPVRRREKLLGGAAPRTTFRLLRLELTRD